MAHPQNRPAKGFGSQIQFPVNKEAERIVKGMKRKSASRFFRLSMERGIEKLCMLRQTNLPLKSKWNVYTIKILWKNMDFDKTFKPIEPKKIPTPATESSHIRSLRQEVFKLRNELNRTEKNN